MLAACIKEQFVNFKCESKLLNLERNEDTEKVTTSSEWMTGKSGGKNLDCEKVSQLTLMIKLKESILADKPLFLSPQFHFHQGQGATELLRVHWGIFL